MSFTEAQRLKALTTRLANKKQRDIARGKIPAEIKNGTLITTEATTPFEVSGPWMEAPTKSPDRNGFNWETAPIGKALEHLSEVKKAYETAAQIVLRRQTTEPQFWTCWVEKYRLDPILGPQIPKLTKQQCRKTGPPGKWASRDDGAFSMIGGIRVPDPAITCSQLCHIAYVTLKPINALSRR